MYIPRWLVDHWIRKNKAQFESLPCARFTVRLATTEKDLEQAFRLVQVSYASLGIEELSDKALRLNEHHLLSEALVLVAHENDRLVGTLSLTLDSPAGLPLDDDFPEDLDRLRETSTRISELGSFAVVQRCRNSGVSQLLAFAATRLAYATTDRTHIAIGVHPKMAPFYRAAFAFTPLGASRPHAHLHAPVVGLVSERQRTYDHLRRHYRRRTPSGFLVHEHTHGTAPIPGTDIKEDAVRAGQRRPPITRAAFQKVFLADKDQVASLRPSTIRHLRTQRSDETLGAFLTRRRLRAS